LIGAMFIFYMLKFKDEPNLGEDRRLQFIVHLESNSYLELFAVEEAHKKKSFGKTEVF